MMNWLVSCYNGCYKRSDSNDHIPQEIITDILSYLPTKSLCRFRVVSKPWLNLINEIIENRGENEPRENKLVISNNIQPICSQNQNPRRRTQLKEKMVNWFVSCYNRCWKRSGSNNQAPNLPAELIFDILSDFPTKSLFQLRAVSKSWLYPINDLIKARLENEPRKQKLVIASQNYPYSFYTRDINSPNEVIEIKNFSNRCLQIIGSFNGVLLLCSVYASSDIFYFFNPRTRNYRYIPKPCDYLNSLIKGLAYDYANDDFKAVLVVTDRLHFDKFYNARAYVYSFQSRLWKRIGFFRYHYCDKPGIVVNGSPHWIVGCRGEPNVIVYFDPLNEKFGELPIPCIGNFELNALGRDLCAIDDNGYIWIFKGSVWNRFSVTPRLEIGVFDGIVDDEFEVFQMNSCDFALFNIKGRRFERRIEVPRDCKKFSAACYVESLTALSFNIG